MTRIPFLKSVSVLLGTVVLLASTSLYAEELQKKAIQISDIDQVELSGPGLLTISQGDTESLEIIASSKLMERIEVDARGTTLRLRLKDKSNWGFFNVDSKIHYQLSVKKLNQLKMTGSADVEAASDLSADRLNIERAGSGDLRLNNVEVTRFRLSSSGSGDFNVTTIVAQDIELSSAGSGDLKAQQLQASKSIELDTAGSGDNVIDKMDSQSLEITMAGSGDTKIGGGNVRNQNIDISGSGTYSAKKMQSEKAFLDLSGSADATVWVTEELSVDASGASDVGYFGRPLLKAETSGASSVKSLGNTPL